MICINPYYKLIYTLFGKFENEQWKDQSNLQHSHPVSKKKKISILSSQKLLYHLYYIILQHTYHPKLYFFPSLFKYSFFLLFHFLFIFLSFSLCLQHQPKKKTTTTTTQPPHHHHATHQHTATPTYPSTTLRTIQNPCRSPCRDHESNPISVQALSEKKRCEIRERVRREEHYERERERVNERQK